MKRGRPFSDNKKTRCANVRFTEEEYNVISNLAEKSGESRSDFIREGIEAWIKLRKLQLENDED